MMIREAHLLEVLQLSKSAVSTTRILRILTTEVHKILNDIYPPIMKIFFSFREKQIQSQKFQKHETGKNKNYSMWSQNSTLLRFTIKFPCI